MVFGLYLAAGGTEQGSFPGAELLHGGLAFAVAWFAGERSRLHIAEFAVRAARAARDRRLAVAEERARIARDLHDTAGHAINVIAVRAGAARTRRDPERSQAALELIEELARQTAAEIDCIVGKLRDRSVADGIPRAPVTLGSLDTLIARHAAGGLDISVTRQGTPQPLESFIDQAAYRILQEALANAARHGAGAARVELTFGDAAMELTISNPARGEYAPRANGGHGLIGMRERATLVHARVSYRRCHRLRFRQLLDGQAPSSSYVNANVHIIIFERAKRPLSHRRSAIGWRVGRSAQLSVTCRSTSRPPHAPPATEGSPPPADSYGAEDPGTRTRIGPIMRLPGVTLRLGHSGRRPALVIRVEGGERLALGPVTAAALLAAAILCAADAPPTLGGVSIVGYGLLAVALWLLARLTAPRLNLSAERRDRPS